MVLIDSSVWIDYFNGRKNRSTDLLDTLSDEVILVGELIVVEVLQGFRGDADFHAAREVLQAFEFCLMVSREIALEAAQNYRSLRERGVTARNTIDTLIGTFCIVNDHQLLHNDRDFDPFERHLGLRVLKSSEII